LVRRFRGFFDGSGVAASSLSVTDLATGVAVARGRGLPVGVDLGPMLWSLFWAN
jgi:hypothetical protein